MKLARINTALLTLIVFINGYIIVMPVVPALHYWWQAHHGGKQKLTTLLHSQATTPKNGTPQKPEPVPPGNRLVIPSMMLDVAFYEGPTARTLNQGPWLRPHTSTPEAGGNTVIAGHRFTYTDPEGDFYHLDLVKPGDEVGLFRDGHKYLYTVTATRVVGPDAIEIEAPTGSAQLTLYTCTPLWNPKMRLVVIAKPATGTKPTGEVL